MNFNYNSYVIYLCFLCIISDPHTNMFLASITPDVVRHLKPDDEDASVKFPSSFSESMNSVVTIEGSMFLGVKVWRIIEVLTLPLSHID